MICCTPWHLLHSPFCQLLMHERMPALGHACFAMGVSMMRPLQCDFSVLQSPCRRLSRTYLTQKQAQRLAAAAFSNCRRTTTEHSFSAPVTSLYALCLSGRIPACRLCLPGQALTHILRVFYSADIGIATASSCDGPTCFVPELVAGSASISLTHPRFLFSRQLAMCQHSASHYCNTILPTCI